MMDKGQMTTPPRGSLHKLYIFLQGAPPHYIYISIHTSNTLYGGAPPKDYVGRGGAGAHIPPRWKPRVRWHPCPPNRWVSPRTFRLGTPIKSYHLIWFDMIWYDLIWFDMMWYDLTWFDMIWHDLIPFDMIWYDLIWFDMIWYELICVDRSW